MIKGSPKDKDGNDLVENERVKAYLEDHYKKFFSKFSRIEKQLGLYKEEIDE